MTALIPLRSSKYPGLSAIVDDEDYESLNRVRWSPNPAGKTSDRFYAVGPNSLLESGSRLMHCVILGRVGVDHINGNGLDNRRCNLRFANQSENCRNRGKRRSGLASRFKGVGRDASRPGKPWRAYITSYGVREFVGSFSTEEEAAHAYDEAAVRLHGEFARLNFPADLQDATNAR